jgi:hypothetical protein
VKTPITKPLNYERVRKLLKLRGAQVRIANEGWLQAEEANAPLWTQNKGLRDLVASHERSIRRLTEERDRYKSQLDTLKSLVGSAT